MFVESCPTFFEMTTALAFEVFASEKVDVAVVEVGLGGRLDSTNVALPILSVITNIALDHTHILGDNLTSIAREKAGIIKERIPVLSGDTQTDVIREVERIASEKGSPCYRLGKDIRISRFETQDLQQVNYILHEGEEIALPTRLIGRHQLPNVAVAYLAGHLVRERGLPLDLDAYCYGLSQAQWPARLMHLDTPYDHVLIDSAHNPDGMQALVDSLHAMWPVKKYDVLLSMLGDKQYEESFRILMPVARSIRVYEMNYPRAAKAEDLVAAIRRIDSDLPVEIVTNLPDALTDLNRKESPLIVGSIYFAGEIYAHILGGQAVELPAIKPPSCC